MFKRAKSMTGAQLNLNVTKFQFQLKGSIQLKLVCRKILTVGQIQFSISTHINFKCTLQLFSKN